MANNVVQAAAIHGDVHITQTGRHDPDAVHQAQEQVITAYRRLDDVQTQLTQMQQQLLASVTAERNITQVVLALQLALMRLQDMIAHLTWQRDHHQHEADRSVAELARTRRELTDAHRSKERTQHQLDRALDERTLAVELIAVLHRKINTLERQLRMLGPDTSSAEDLSPAQPSVPRLPHVGVGVDLAGVDAVVHRIGAYLDEQHQDLSHIAEAFAVSPTPTGSASATADWVQPTTRDELTGLLNRRGAMKLLRALLSGDAAAASHVAVLFCDIDNFKRINESLGHEAGDELLVAVARNLERGLPEGSVAARVSADEYVVVCPDVRPLDGVEQFAALVAPLFQQAVPLQGQLVRVSASIGAVTPTDTLVTGEDLLRFADAAMYEAKRRGYGRMVVASAGLVATADRQVQLEGELHDAIAADALTLHYQPVVDVNGTILTAEALVRWQHPEYGLLTPDVFLPVAARSNLLLELDSWVLRTALRAAVGWPEPAGRRIAVAVNLSALAPGDPGFTTTVADAVAESGIGWDRIVLELVETLLAGLSPLTIAEMAHLVDRGVRFAVDDFGTGYSSLARLKDLPAQIIKVDRRFVSGVGEDPADFAVAQAVMMLARAMGRSCVGEAVETATQFHVLRGIGADAYQGWLFSRPVPGPELHQLLMRGSLPMPKAG
ncbi:bifunctional diguanylate cyclase/phosphodiesterase [Kutzneria buriramensis]|uniref:Diguanylate cyclase (GGDEF)-like protein n=1 Tax=Kutzneria buriramensis TaxID=1045776 RepID=A0A3E0I904_9PSEU|nr:bifunctional diguanylate cyclase/phosphodiesterase [Kutzneria buriramensis]REH55223.1 diguanylate cyclase (GGDEF)-like protein [Kutzneria buriramensis]